MRRVSPAPASEGDAAPGKAGAADDGLLRDGGGWKLLLMKAPRPRGVAELERGVWAESSVAIVDGLVGTARGIAARAAAGRGVLLIKTGWVAASAGERMANAAGFGRKTDRLLPAALPAVASGEETSFIVNFGTGALVAAVICRALTPSLRILPPEKE